MNTQNNITRFESELSKVQRPGVDKLLGYIRKSDFYTAPASTKYHLAVPGGLLQHSLNVLDALRGLLIWNDVESIWMYNTAGKTVDRIPDESVIIMALLHDICKTYFYNTATRNVKNEKTGKWEKAPYFTVNDRMPLGHGAKSAMIVKEYITLKNPELYAIWHHMGFSGDYETNAAFGKSIELYPSVLALHTADVMASRFMEGEKENSEGFTESVMEPSPEQPDDQPAGEPVFEEAPPLDEGSAE